MNNNHFTDAGQLVTAHDERLLAWGALAVAERRVAELERYVDELETIIYHSVGLTDILRNGDSEATYNRIIAKHDAVIAEAWARLKA